MKSLFDGANVTIMGDAIYNTGTLNKTYINGVEQTHTPAAQHAQQAGVVEDIVPVDTNQPAESTTTQSQPINFTLLEEYLNLRFYDSNPNYHKVVDMLSSNGYSDRDKAYFALKIYDTPNIIKPIKRPETFSEWYAILANIFHFPYHSNYSPNKLTTPSKNAKKIDQFIKMPILKR